MFKAIKATVKPQLPLLQLIGYFSALFGLFMISDFAIAAGGGGLGDVADTVTQSMGNVAKLISAAAYVAGIGFALTGMMKFKAHKDNPTQVPLSQPITLLAIAAGLVFLPSIIKSGGATIFGGSETTGGAEGSGIESIQ